MRYRNLDFYHRRQLDLGRRSDRNDLGGARDTCGFLIILLDLAELPTLSVP